MQFVDQVSRSSIICDVQYSVHQVINNSVRHRLDVQKCMQGLIQQNMLKCNPYQLSGHERAVQAQHYFPDKEFPVRSDTPHNYSVGRRTNTTATQKTRRNEVQMGADNNNSNSFSSEDEKDQLQQQQQVNDTKKQITPPLSNDIIDEDDCSTAVLTAPHSSKTTSNGVLSKLLNRKMLLVLALGFSFCTVFTAFGTTQGFITTLKKKLGFQSLAILYAFFAVSNFISPVIVDRTGPKISLLIGAIPYSLFVLASCFSNAPLLLSCAALLGVGASVLWTAHGQFLTEIAGSEMGFFSGVFFGVFQLSNIVGNLLTGALLRMGVSIFWTFFILFCISVVGIAMLLTLFLDRGQTAPEESSTTSKKKKKKSKSIARRMRSTLDVLLDMRMLLFLPISLYSGYSISVFTGVLPPIIRDHTGVEMISWVATCFGLAEAIGSIAFGKLIDIFGRRIMMIATLILHIIAVVLCWTMLLGGVPLYFVTLFFCGLADSGYNTSIYSILGSPAFFKKRASDAFAGFKMVQSIASACGFLSSTFATTGTIKIILSVLCGTAVISFLVLDFFIAPSDKTPPDVSKSINETSTGAPDNETF